MPSELLCGRGRPLRVRRGPVDPPAGAAGARAGGRDAADHRALQPDVRRGSLHAWHQAHLHRMLGLLWRVSLIQP